MQLRPSVCHSLRSNPASCRLTDSSKLVRSKALSLLRAIFSLRSASEEGSELGQVQLEALQGTLPALQLMHSDDSTQVSERGAASLEEKAWEHSPSQRGL